MKVFVSIPMNGRSIEDVKYDQNHCLEELTRDFKNDGTLGEDETLTLIDVNERPTPAPANASRLWYLGEAIKRLDEADLVYFASDWYKAKGCWVEFVAAHVYEKEVVYYYHSNFALDRIRWVISMIFACLSLKDSKEDV